MRSEEPTGESDSEPSGNDQQHNGNNNAEDPTKIDIGPDVIRQAPKALWHFIRDLLSIREGVQYQTTVTEITKSIEFKGYSIWVLMCSIGVACVGLNNNSAAVIIGAMLISPLMGPIRGIGLAAGTNDLKLLFKSLKNFGVMVGVSLLIAFLYFWATPLKSETPEILSRVRPQILDVIVAFVGGLAGIIAATRNDVSTVVPGVAIATALMPPLCTAGFGIATGNASYFLGAMYLFLLNSLFICLSTLIVVRYLKFPIKHFINPRTQRRVQMIIGGFLLLVIIPSGFKFYEVIQESIFFTNSQDYVNKVIRPYEDAHLASEHYVYENNEKVIEVFFIGKTIPPEIVREWERRLQDYNLEEAELKIFQDEDTENMGVSSEYLIEAQRKHGQDLERMARDIAAKESRLRTLSEQLEVLKPFEVDLKRLDRKLAFEFPEMVSYSYSTALRSNLQGASDTIITILPLWNDSLTYREVNQKEDRLKQWMAIEMDEQHVEIVSKNKPYPEHLLDPISDSLNTNDEEAEE